MRRVTKEQALTLLEMAVRHQELINGLHGVLGNIETEGVHLAEYLKALFGRDFNDMENDEYDYYWEAFNHTLELDITVSEKAAIIYEKVNTKLSESNSQVIEEYQFNGTLKKVA